MNSITQQTFQRNDKDFMSTPVDGEMVLMHRPTGQLIGMNTSAGVIWAKLETPQSYASIIKYLLTTFDVERATCEAQTQLVLERMLKDRLIASVSEKKEV